MENILLQSTYFSLLPINMQKRQVLICLGVKSFLKC